MGSFTLSAHFVMPKENDKEVEIPDDAIAFQYDPRATADDTLIDYIVQQTHKMRSLAAGDLDSYLVLGKQFLNIGKPFKIEGLGMLVKNQQGALDFFKDTHFHINIENTPAALKEKTTSSDISFSSESKTDSSGKKGLLIIILAIIFGLAGTAAWYFFNNTDKVSSNNTPAAIQQTKTVKENIKPTDTVAGNVAAAVHTNDGYTFKVVLMQTADSVAAVARMNVLTARQHTIIMYKSDSAKYRLAEPFSLPLTDTARIKDSLNKFYYKGKAFIQLQ